MSEVPQEIQSVIENLDMKESSKQKARTDIMDYVEWVIDRQGSFPTENEPVQHVRFIDSYLQSQKNEGYARETIAGRWTWITRLYEELSMTILNEYAFFDENPIELLENRTGKTRSDYLPNESEESQKKKRYYIDKDDLDLLCDNVPSPAFRNETMLRLAWTTGLRRSEIANLKLEDVNIEENLLEEFWVPKAAKPRSLWIPDKTVWFLDQYINAGYRDAFGYSEGSDYLFVTNSGPEMNPNLVNKIVNQSAEEAGIQEVINTDKSGHERRKVTAHSLRRGHGMHLWQAGKQLPEIQHRLGHSSPEQTNDYLPITVEESKAKIEDITF